MIDSKFFINMVDSIVELSFCDKQLAKEIKQLDQLAQDKHITFYEVIYHVLHDDI